MKTGEKIRISTVEQAGKKGGEMLKERLAAELRSIDYRQEEMQRAREMKAEHGITIKALLEEVARQRQLRAERDEAQRLPYPRTLQQRLKDHLIELGQQEIRRRRLTTPTGWGDANPIIIDRDIANRLWIIGAEYYFNYSAAVGYWVGANYLCGRDDGGVFAMRIPKSCNTIVEALKWITPAAVIEAQRKGRWTGRQGDVWLVELVRGKDNLRDLPPGHEYDPESRCLTHRSHQPLLVPAGVKAVRAFTQHQIHQVGGAD